MKIAERFLSENRIMAAMNLYPGKSRKDVVFILAAGLSKRIRLIVLILVPVVILFTAAEFKQRGETGDPFLIEREDVNGDDRLVDVRIETDEGWKNGTVSISAISMSDEEIDAMEAECEKALDDLVPGTNPSFSEVSAPLVFPESLDGFPVVLSWTTDDPETVTRDGTVKNEDISESRNVLIKAKVAYGSEFRTYERIVTVVPAEKDSEWQVRQGIKEIERIEGEGRGAEQFSIPDNILGMRVEVEKKGKIPYIGLGIMFSFAVSLYLYSSYFSGLKTKRKKRLENAKVDYKGFVSKLTLLLAAGMALRQAWKKLSHDYSEGRKKTGMLAQVLKVSEQELENGESEPEVYERFGERMEDISYQRLASILSQQVTKGVNDLNATLTSELKEVVAKEREEVRIRGEEAGTRLLVPMMGMLIIVFAILLMPALTSF
ncbi:MAG: type II secretion system F family protein [Lachnospiraceae bacterium]|nr:type II secretion system F family protein [Lachnospiraceae bacterium]